MYYLFFVSHAILLYASFSELKKKKNLKPKFKVKVKCHLSNNTFKDVSKINMKHREVESAVHRTIYIAHRNSMRNDNHTLVGLPLF